MTSRISTRRKADDDLIRAYARLAEYDIDSADLFLDAVGTSFERLAQLPLAGSPRSVRASKLAGIRMWRIPAFPRYLIFYFPTVDGIDVVRVLHSSRDINSILDDESIASDEPDS